MQNSYAAPPVDLYAQAELEAAEHANGDNWKCFMYHSRRDPRVCVPKRFGVGYTVNLATAAGKGFCAVILLITTASIIMSIVLASHPDG